MEPITVKKEDLLTAVRKNRDEHKAIFDEAVKGYKARAIELLEDHIKRIEKGGLEKVMVSLPVPENHTDDYDRVIRMLEMDVEDTIKIHEDEFRAYVMDDWAWARAFAASTADYSRMSNIKYGTQPS